MPTQFGRHVYRVGPLRRFLARTNGQCAHASLVVTRTPLRNSGNRPSRKERLPLTRCMGLCRSVKGFLQQCPGAFSRSAPLHLHHRSSRKERRPSTPNKRSLHRFHHMTHHTHGAFFRSATMLGKGAAGYRVGLPSRLRHPFHNPPHAIRRHQDLSRGRIRRYGRRSSRKERRLPTPSLRPTNLSHRQMCHCRTLSLRGPSREGPSFSPRLVLFGFGRFGFDRDAAGAGYPRAAYGHVAPPASTGLRLLLLDR